MGLVKPVADGLVGMSRPGVAWNWNGLSGPLVKKTPVSLTSPGTLPAGTGFGGPKKAALSPLGFLVLSMSGSTIGLGGVQPLSVAVLKSPVPTKVMLKRSRSAVQLTIEKGFGGSSTRTAKTCYCTGIAYAYLASQRF